jgi:hypothetical protein
MPCNPVTLCRDLRRFYHTAPILHRREYLPICTLLFQPFLVSYYLWFYIRNVICSLVLVPSSPACWSEDNGGVAKL